MTHHNSRAIAQHREDKSMGDVLPQQGPCVLVTPQSHQSVHSNQNPQDSKRRGNSRWKENIAPKPTHRLKSLNSNSTAANDAAAVCGCVLVHGRRPCSALVLQPEPALPMLHKPHPGPRQPLEGFGPHWQKTHRPRSPSKPRGRPCLVDASSRRCAVPPEPWQVAILVH